MLRALQVENIALLHKLQLELQPGFTCLTGETGAGKSILLDAVGLLLGSRGSSELVRTGADKGVVEGVLDIPDESSDSVRRLCAEQGIDTDGDQLVISREVFAAGKTVARVNGRIVTVQFLRLLGTFCAHQHGQHDTAVLLRAEEHLALLDAYGGSSLADVKTRYAACHRRLTNAANALKKAESDSKERAQRLDMLAFQIQEITKARIQAGEEDRLRDLRRRLQHAEKLRSATDDVYEKVYEGAPRAPAIADEVYRLAEVTETAMRFDESLEELHGYLETAQVNLAEAADFVRRYRSRQEFAPEELQRVEDRLAVLLPLFRKYGETSSAVLEYLRRAREEQEQLLRHEETIANLTAERASANEELQAAAHDLTAVREFCAVSLEDKLTAELSLLMMPNVRLGMRLTPTSPGPLGADDAELLISANQGEAQKSLAKIASGGELSRVMLALIQVLSGGASVPTLIFDEIDAGISGRAAQAVAERVAHLGSRHQVLCVTHLPQMACYASHHLLIDKRIDGERTFTTVKPLSAEERVDEIAKMISGEIITETTRSHAREMLRRGARPL
ncbi:MAG: DNA repair protein RecN [Bacilli bacterium]